MNRPILYRVVFYSIFIGLCTTIMSLLSLMNQAPFTTINMRTAYYDGCNIGLHSQLTVESIRRCDVIADTYKETLDSLDKQMNNEY